MAATWTPGPTPTTTARNRPAGRLSRRPRTGKRWPTGRPAPAGARSREPGLVGRVREVLGSPGPARPGPVGGGSAGADQDPIQAGCRSRTRPAPAAAVTDG